MMIDSDKDSLDSPAASTKERVAAEFERNEGLAWITAGREVENYLPIDVFTTAAKRVHSKSTVHTDASEGQFEDLAKRVTTELNKVAVATAAIEASQGVVWDVLDLHERVALVVDYIRASN